MADKMQKQKSNRPNAENSNQDTFWAGEFWLINLIHFSVYPCGSKTRLTSSILPPLQLLGSCSPLLQFVRELHLEAQRTSSSFWRNSLCPSFLQYHHAICFLLFSGPTDQLVLFAEEIFKLAAFFVSATHLRQVGIFVFKSRGHSVEERWPAQLSTFSREERWWIRKLIFSFALWRPHFSFLLSCSLTDRQLLLQGFIFLRIVVWHFSKLLLSIGPFLSSTVIFCFYVIYVHLLMSSTV